MNNDKNEKNIDNALQVGNADQFEQDNSNLIVNFMPPDMDDKEVFDMFSRFGPIRSARVIRDLATNKSRCFGFVHFKSPNNAMLAQTSLNGCELRGKRLKVAVSRAAMSENVVQLSSLPVQFSTKQRLFCLFQGYGYIMDINIPKDPRTCYPYGVAFIHFATRSAAKNAIMAMHGCRLDEDWHPLQARFLREAANPPSGE